MADPPVPAASDSTLPSTGPMHGVQAKAKAMPITGGAQAPSTEGRTMNRRSPERAAGTGGSATGGIALLLAYSLGLGVPFLLSGLAFGRMTDALARVRGRLWIVDLVGGAVLIVFGLLLLTGNVHVVSAHIGNWLRDLHLDRLSTSSGVWRAGPGPGPVI